MIKKSRMKRKTDFGFSVSQKHVDHVSVVRADCDSMLHTNTIVSVK